MRKRVRVTHPTDSPLASPKAVTQQHLREGADINAIVAKARRGIPPTGVREGGSFVDLSETPQSLDEAYAAVQRAESSFAALPARARDELGNDPRRILSASADFFVRHGLAKLVEPQAAPEARQESEGGRPSGKPPQAASKAPKAPKSEPFDQD